MRKARFAYDESETKPYFELNQVLTEGVFYAATELHGVTLKELHDLPVYRPEVRTFEVFDGDGSPLATTRTAAPGKTNTSINHCFYAHGRWSPTT